MCTAQAPASAGEVGAQWEVSGDSTTFCSSAWGDYSYSRVPGTTDRYSAGWDLFVTAQGHCGMNASLRIKYSEWSNGYWWPRGWTTIATAHGNPISTDYMTNVKDIRFAVCDYNGGHYACGTVS
ncbi:hypothetical protein [Streptomyces sp. NBC_01565]|uniref:hypothetical protein n=1 Tax=unclassified Streptomyces TaxID=2593676 RepID=UPI00225AC5D4|nr:hypothetical protein [Streptomyces sp. NBC_01565]MCX4546604.1 hypothetical protein [Streptomyces sp. NBC_01565]